MIPDGVVDAISAALDAQRQEFESGFETTNEPLQHLIDHVDPADLLEACAPLLGSGNPGERILGVRVLRELRSHRRQAVQLIAGAVGREDEDDVLGWLVSGLRFLGDESAFPVVEALVSHPDERVREQVAGAISSCTGSVLRERGLAALLRLANDASGTVRFSALFELGEWWKAGARDDRLESALRDARTTGDPRLQSLAEDALGPNG